MKTGIYLLILAEVAFLTFPIRAQENEWLNYTVGNWVYAMVDAGNYLWIGNGGGLVRFDKTTEQLTFYTKANANLPENHVWSLAMDSSGYLWIGTQSSGVGKFDGKTCQVFNKANSDLPHDQWNTALAVDSSGRIWIGSQRYLSIVNNNIWKSYESESSIFSYVALRDIKFDRKGNAWIGASWGLGKFASDTLIRRFGGISKEVRSLALDKDDNLWIGTYNYGLMRLQGETYVVFDTTNSGIPTNRIYDIEFDRVGNLWLATSLGLVQFDGVHWKIFNKDNSGLAEDALSSLEIDSQGTIWIGTFQSHLYRFDGINWKKYSPSQTGLSSLDVSSLALEFNGNRWITSWGDPVRLIRYDGMKWEVYDTANVEFLDSYFNRAYKDSSRKIWNNSDVLVSYERSNGWRAYDIANRHRGSRMKVDKFGNIWQASNQGLWKFNGNAWTVYNTSNSPLPTNLIARIAFDHHDNLWLSTMPNYYPEKGLLLKFDGTTWTTQYTCDVVQWVAGIETDSSDNIWIGILDRGMVGQGYGGGLKKYDGVNWTSYNISNSGLSSNSVVDLCLDQDQNLWIGTYSGGLSKFDRKDKWTVYHARNSGLPGNNVEVIGIDAMNNKWLGVQYGGLAVFREGGVIITDIREDDPQTLPRTFFLSQNYPNPFNPSTSIQYQLPKDGFTTLKVFNVLGEEIATLISEFRRAGSHQTLFNASSLPSGVYFYRLESSGMMATQKMLLLR